MERLVEYHSEPEEKPAISHPRPPPEWPQAGAIEAVQLVVRYRPALPPVLKGLSFKVKANEKVGICGRTGAQAWVCFVSNCAIFGVLRCNCCMKLWQQLLRVSLQCRLAREPTHAVCRLRCTCCALCSLQQEHTGPAASAVRAACCGWSTLMMVRSAV